MSRLEKSSEKFRKDAIVKNEYNISKGEYYAGHGNAISDGDDKGKGESDAGDVGSKTDIKIRGKSLKKNKYSKDKPYSSSNA